jgi:endonuclease I
LRNRLPLLFAALLALACFAGPSATAAFAGTPYPLASGDYLENFNDITNWTNNFASGIGAQYWQSVPSNATGTIPDGVKITVATTAFTNTTSGGVQKGSGNIQLLSTNGTDNINACAIDLLLDFTGRNPGTLSYNFATAFNTTGNRNGSLRVYTSVDGATFTELPAASVVNFQNNVAFSQTITAVALPAAFANCATARIRFYDYNGTGPAGSSGARPKASIDNVQVATTPLGYGNAGGPQISNVVTIPAAPLDTSLVTVQATVVDTARVLNAVSLAWGTGNNALTNIVSMGLIAGDTWQTSAPIPAAVAGTTIRYQISAVDDSITVQTPILSYVVGSTGGGGTGAPTIASVFQSSDSTLQVFFSTAVDPLTSQVASNYDIDTNVPVSAVRDPLNNSLVTLTVRNLPFGDRTLTVNGVADLFAHFETNQHFVFHYVNVTIPAGYYDPANGLRGSALLIALHNIIKAHTSISYSATANAFQNTDKRPDGKVWDVYSDVPGGTPPYEFTFGPLGSGGSEGIAYNREHSFPQSWFNGSVLPMYSDLWIIYPTDSKVNGARGNYPYGKVGTATFTSLNGTKLGNCISAGYSGTCFEPIDGYKGDLARSQFYVASRYFNEDGSWPGGASTNKSQLLAWAADQYRQWSSADSVSWKERLRNGAIYEIQHNRNPFVDHPEFVSAIYDSTNVTGVGSPTVLTHSLLRSASPNPFGPRTTLAYDLAQRAHVSLRMYDISGRLVRTLVAGSVQEAGSYSLVWDGRDDAGLSTSAGLYFCRLEAGSANDTRRVVHTR